MMSDTLNGTWCLLWKISSLHQVTPTATHHREPFSSSSVSVKQAFIVPESVKTRYVCTPSLKSLIIM